MAKRRDEPDQRQPQSNGLSDGEQTSETDAGRQNSPPTCPGCKVPLKSNRTEPYFTRYYCPNKCGYSQKIPRPALRKMAQRGESLPSAEDHSAR